MGALAKVTEGIGLRLRDALAATGGAAWTVPIIAVVLPYTRCGAGL